jgi:hypothetical protein
VETEKTRRRREESDLEAARAKAERAAEAERVGGEGGGGGGAGGGQLEPVTSDEAKRSRKRGGREDRQETQPHEKAPGKGRGVREDPQRR